MEVKNEFLEELCDNNDSTSKRAKFNVNENDFLDLLTTHPCLISKSITPTMKKRKLDALLEIQMIFKNKHRVNISTTQIKKKIENMKSRIKQKADKLKAGNKEIMLKQIEKKWLNLMDHENTPQKIQGANQIGVPGTSRSFKDDVEWAPKTQVEDVLDTEEEDVSAAQSIRTPQEPKKTSVKSNHSIVLKLQKEVLELQKQKLLLQMTVLESKQENLNLEKIVLKSKVAQCRTIKLEENN